MGGGAVHNTKRHKPRFILCIQCLFVVDLYPGSAYIAHVQATGSTTTGIYNRSPRLVESS